MGQVHQHRYTLDEYFAIEATSTVKHEFIGGLILAMAGASLAHSRIASNVLALLATGLRPRSWEAFGSDLRVATGNGVLTYPDLAVVCGPIELLPDRPDTLTNPTAPFEVLSPSTCDYDGGEKLASYQTIPSLQEVLQIDQEREEVRRVARAGQGWEEQVVSAPGASVELAGVTLPLREIYQRVFRAP